MAKRKLQYDALVQPILVEVSVANDVAVFSASQVNISFLQKFQYKSRFEPVLVDTAPVEEITLDKWFVAHGLPYNKKSNYYLVTGDTTQPVLVVQEVIRADALFNIQATPQRRKRNTATGEGFLYVEPPIVDQVTLDKWLQDRPLPTRRKPRLTPGGNSLTEILSSENVKDIRSVDGSVPAKRKSGMSPQSFFFIELVNVGQEDVTLDKWFQNTVQPIRKKRNVSSSITEPIVTTAPVAYVGVFSLGTSVVTFNLKFQYQSRFEPLRSLVQVEQVTLDKWLQNTNQPTRKKKAPQTESTAQPVFVPPVVEQVTLDKWFTGIIQPIRKTRTTQPVSGISPIRVELIEEATLDKWLQNTSQPVRKKQSRAHLYPIDFSSGSLSNQITLDRWLGSVFGQHNRAKNLWYLYLTESHNISPIPRIIGINVSLGYNKNTNTGIGKRGLEEKGRNKNTNTGIGKANNPQRGRNNNTNTGIGKKLQKL